MKEVSCPILPNPYLVSKKLITCKFCKSPNVVKRGIRTGIQYFTCKDCERTFAFNSAHYRMRKKKEAIGNGIQMFYDGIATKMIYRIFSLWNIANEMTLTSKNNRLTDEQVMILQSSIDEMEELIDDYHKLVIEDLGFNIRLRNENINEGN